MSELHKQIEAFEKLAVQEMQTPLTLDTLQALKVKFLGKKGRLADILKSLGTLSPEGRKEIGQAANQAKDRVEQAFLARETTLKEQIVLAEISTEQLDVTLPGLKPPLGSHHPVMQVYEDSKQIFKHLGFDSCYGPEIETDYYNFAALNIPANHPARDMQATFYFADGKLLRTHTSPVQIHVMEGSKPPIAMVAPGVVYRSDSDQTHTPMFHQIEGLLVDTGIHFGHLKAVAQEYLQKIFARELKFRFRSSFFPFTEPSAEVDISCVFCEGKGCRVCKHSGWLEVMGCGMVDPNVFAFVGIDANKYSGFAFGAGLERIAMLKYSINDIRLFFENDIRFLRQFS